MFNADTNTSAKFEILIKKLRSYVNLSSCWYMNVCFFFFYGEFFVNINHVLFVCVENQVLSKLRLEFVKSLNYLLKKEPQ